MQQTGRTAAVERPCSVARRSMTVDGSISWVSYWRIDFTLCYNNNCANFESIYTYPNTRRCALCRGVSCTGASQKYRNSNKTHTINNVQYSSRAFTGGKTNINIFPVPLLRRIKNNSTVRAQPKHTDGKRQDYGPPKIEASQDTERETEGRGAGVYSAITIICMKTVPYNCILRYILPRTTNK